MKIACIGAGRRLCNMLEGMHRLGIEVAAVADPQPEIVRARFAALKIDCRHTLFVPDAEVLLRMARQFDGFAIGLRCHQHAELAVRVAATDKPLFLEKPVAITQAQLDAVAAAWKGREDRVVVSFPLHITPVFRIALETVRIGRLGVINQIQAFNNVSYGDVYYETWYRRFEQTGGLWLQKATHDFDYLNQLVGARPVRICAMMTQRIFGNGRPLQPDRPPSADLPHVDAYNFRLGDEDITDRDAQLDDFGSRFHAAIRNQDAGSAIIWYANGVVASYDQNFVTRRSAGSRGARVVGYNGTLEWTWNPRERLRIIDHHSPRVDEIECPAEDGHSGGDAALHRAFLEVMRGRPHTAGNLTDGMLSAAMCLAARRAAQRHTVETIPDFGNFPAPDRTVDPMTIESAPGVERPAPVTTIPADYAERVGERRAVPG